MRHRHELSSIKLLFFVFSILSLSITSLAKAHAIDQEAVLSLGTGMPGKIIISSISQDGTELEKQYDTQNNIHYYPTKRSSSSIQFKIRPENLEDNHTYELDYSCNDNSQCIHALTPADNDKDIIVSAVPNYVTNPQGLVMGYGVISFSFSRDHTQYEQSTKFIIRPNSIGSEHVIIESISQNSNELEYVDGYYKISDYNTPINITYRIIGLTTGRLYDTFLGAGNGAGSGRGMMNVNNSEVVIHDSFYLDPTVDKNICGIHLWEIENYEITGKSDETIHDTVSVPFKYVSDFTGFDSVIIDQVAQNGMQIEARNGYIELNTLDDIEFYIHTNSAMDSTYYIVDFDGSTPQKVLGRKLKDGIVLKVNPRRLKTNYERNNGIYTLNSIISGIQENPYSLKQVSIRYGTSSSLKLKFIEEAEKEFLDSAKIYYSNDSEVQCKTNIYNLVYACTVESEDYELNKTIKVKLNGVKYDDNKSYNVSVSLDRNNHRNIDYGIYEYSTNILGSEINNGALINLGNILLTQIEYHYPYRNAQYSLNIHIEEQMVTIPFNYKKKEISQNIDTSGTETADNDTNSDTKTKEKDSENINSNNRQKYSSVKLRNGKYEPITSDNIGNSDEFLSYNDDIIKNNDYKQDANLSNTKTKTLEKESTNNSEQNDKSDEKSNTLIIASIGTAIVIISSVAIVFLKRKI